MPDWIVEEGIGETRAARFEQGEIVETRVRRDGVTPAGTVLEAKLVAVAPRMTVEAGGEQFLLPRGASGVSEGRTLTIEVTREALGGREGWKRGLARVTDAAPCPAPPRLSSVLARCLSEGQARAAAPRPARRQSASRPPCRPTPARRAA